MSEKLPEMSKSEVWRCNFERTYIEVVRWDFDKPKSQYRRPWADNWNYYVYIYEQYCSDFDSLWMEPEVKRWTPSSPERISYDYYGNEKICEIEMHGGITFYEQYGLVKGHRSIKIGCDFQHLGDEGMIYTMEHVLCKAVETARQCVEKFYRPIEVTT